MKLMCALSQIVIQKRNEYVCRSYQLHLHQMPVALASGFQNGILIRESLINHNFPSRPSFLPSFSVSVSVSVLVSFHFIHSISPQTTPHPRNQISNPPTPINSDFCRMIFGWRFPACSIISEVRWEVADRSVVPSFGTEQFLGTVRDSTKLVAMIRLTISCFRNHLPHRRRDLKKNKKSMLKPTVVRKFHFSFTSYSVDTIARNYKISWKQIKLGGLG